MNRLILLGTAVALATACSGGDDGKLSDTEASDTDNTSDTDASDTETSDTEGGTPGACSVWTGVHGVGTTWTYEFTDGSLDGSYTVEITAYDEATGEIEMTSVSEYTASGYDTVSTTVTEGKCDSEGYWNLGLSGTAVTTVSGTDYESSFSTTYDNPVLLLPSGELSVGDTWTSTSSGTTSAGGYDTDFSYTTTHEITQEVDIDVPAGSYTTLMVEATTDGTTSTSWLARLVGTVMTDSSELTDYAE